MKERGNFRKNHEVLKEFIDTIKDAMKLPKYQAKKGQGVRKYGQPKRNAFKISGSSFGNLSVDVPKLMHEMKLEVKRGGEIVMQRDVDKSLVDLLTKRFNPKKTNHIECGKSFQ